LRQSHITTKVNSHNSGKKLWKNRSALKKKFFYVFFRFCKHGKDFFSLAGKIFSSFLSLLFESWCQKAYSHNSGMSFSKKNKAKSQKSQENS
jgi:hypothetical protein